MESLTWETWNSCLTFSSLSSRISKSISGWTWKTKHVSLNHTSADSRLNVQIWQWPNLLKEVFHSRSPLAPGRPDSPGLPGKPGVPSSPWKKNNQSLDLTFWISARLHVCVSVPSHPWSCHAWESHDSLFSLWSQYAWRSRFSWISGQSGLSFALLNERCKSRPTLSTRWTWLALFTYKPDEEYGVTYATRKNRRLNQFKRFSRNIKIEMLYKSAINI